MTLNNFNLLPSRPEARLQVQALQKKFFERANEDPSRVFDGIYNLVYQPAVLVEAAARVLSNKGANTPGLDGITKAMIDEKGRERFILRLHKELRGKNYNPSPLRPTTLKPSNGKPRPLKTPTIADRVVQTAVVIVLEGIFEAEFLPVSHAYRTRLFHDIPWGCHTALYGTKLGIEENPDLTHVLEGDIVGCFDNIDHGLLLRRLRRRVKDKNVLGLIGRFLRAGTAINGRIERTDKGTAQGGCVSPFLCNVALTALDEGVSLGSARKNPPPSPMLTSAPFHYERYADDFIVLVLGEKNAKDTKDFIGEFLSTELKMELSASKTHITELHDGFTFLGHRVWKNETPAGTTCRLSPSRKKLEGLFEDLLAIVRNEKHSTDRQRRAEDRVRGFADYYFLVQGPEKEVLEQEISSMLEALGLSPGGTRTARYTMTQRFAS